MTRRLLLAALGATVVLAAWVLLGIPSRGAVRALAKENPGKTGVMKQREEEARKAKRPVRHAQSWVPVGRVSKHLVHAVLSAEDQKFFGHEGVDWEAVQKSFEEDRRQWRLVRGGSTITQQLAKNLFFTTHKSLVRKLRELIVARWLEQDLTKRRILELYLNVIEWGDGVYGVEAAARRYYGKSASTLTAEEAAGLAAMIPNPRRINPRVNAGRHARATRRVLWLMARNGYLGRSGIGAEPPPEPVEDDGPEEPEPELPDPPPSAAPVEATAPAARATAEPATSEPEAPPTPAAEPVPAPASPEASPPSTL